MSYLIDTCCISELVKKKPNPNVVMWFADRDELSMYLSVISFGELRKGVEKLPDSKTKKELNRWVKEDLNHRFPEVIGTGCAIGLQRVASSLDPASPHNRQTVTTNSI
jgi:predicted nucleic acid-binding protein